MVHLDSWKQRTLWEFSFAYTITVAHYITTAELVALSGGQNKLQEHDFSIIQSLRYYIQQFSCNNGL